MFVITVLWSKPMMLVRDEHDVKRFGFCWCCKGLPVSMWSNWSVLVKWELVRWKFAFQLKTNARNSSCLPFIPLVQSNGPVPHMNVFFSMA